MRAGGHYQVIVVGGGTAGSIAAVAAARNGADTLLLEENGYLGGTATGGLVTPFMPNRLETPAGPVNLNGGMTEELKERLTAIGSGGRTPENDGWFDPEGLKSVLEDMAVEAGAELLYYTRVLDVLVSDAQPGRVLGVLAHNQEGLTSFTAGVVIDATGDADVAVAAGVPWRSGGPNGQRQALSVRFIAGGIDVDRLAASLRELGEPSWPAGYLEAAMVWGRGFKLEPLFQRAVEAGDLSREDGDYFQCFTLPGRPGQLAFNCPRISRRVDGTNARDLTHAQVEGRHAIRRLVGFLREYLPGCEKAHVLQVAPMVGVRESRRIVGDYVLTLQDILTARKFPDAVLRNRYPVDIHLVGSEARDGRAAEPVEDDPAGTRGAPPEGEYHEAPYRCLLPQGVDGLIVAGRCLSATFAAQSAIRIEPNCHSLGQAAGTAAALAVRSGLMPRQVDGIHLREVLRSQGAYL